MIRKGLLFISYADHNCFQQSPSVKMDNQRKFYCENGDAEENSPLNPSDVFLNPFGEQKGFLIFGIF